MQTLLRLALTVVGWLPLPFLHGCGWLMGTALWLAPNRFRAITQRHLERCLPTLDARARHRVARKSLIESAKAVCEAPAIWFGPWNRVSRWIADETARALLRNEWAAGQGVILLTPHLGSWELASFFCGQIAPITVLYKPQKGLADAVLLSGRARRPEVRPSSTGGSGVKALLSALRRGELIGLLPDHDPPDGTGTAFAPFFGIPANTMELVSRLAERSAAPVWFIVAERLSWGRGFRIHLKPAAKDIGDSVHGPRALNAGIEACVRQWPEQYWWSYKRYRRRPAGSEDFYAGL